MIETIMKRRDCGKSEALKYAVRLVGHAMQYDDSELTLTDERGTSILPIVRKGAAA